ncbi:MAG: PRC and DUF2382 domain-containing protein [Thermomicrobiales bacterium]
MSWSNTTTPVQIGDDVYGNDGDKVGTVADVQPTYLVVEKGFFFPTDYYIPFSAITQVNDGQVVLNVSKDTALHSGWDTVPEATNDAIMTGDRGWDLASEVAATDRVLAEDTGRVNAGVPRQAAYEATSEDEIVIPVREEELTATVRETEAGAARIQKRVVAEDRVLEVPVTEEQIRVERRVVDRPATAIDADAFQETVIDVPLTQQEVELRKQARVAEEVVVSKEAIQHTEQVRGTVRREEVDVVDEGVLNQPIPGQDRTV